MGGTHMDVDTVVHEGPHLQGGLIHKGVDIMEPGALTTPGHGHTVCKRLHTPGGPPKSTGPGSIRTLTFSRPGTVESIPRRQTWGKGPRGPRSGLEAVLAGSPRVLGT